jgi:hypothetical protein
MKRHQFATLFVSLYLLVYTVLFHAGAPLQVLGVMFLISPFLVLWMVYSILRYGTYTGRELGPDEEWGYQDKDSDELRKRRWY